MKTDKDEPIVAMIEHTLNGKPYIFVATTRSVYVGEPGATGEGGCFKVVPFEAIEHET